MEIQGHTIRKSWSFLNRNKKLLDSGRQAESQILFIKRIMECVLVRIMGWALVRIME